jgi:hypothetical protein
MRKSTWIPVLAVPILIILAFVGGRVLYYGGASAYTPPQHELSEIEFEASAKSARLEAVDNPIVSQGVVAIDYGHKNALYIEELNVLLSKIVARGFSYEIIFNSEDEDEDEDKDTGGNRDQAKLADKLRYAKTLILPLPREEYTPEEIVEIERFVEKGGRLLIIGDPTRTIVVEALNSIAGSFDIIYANDYLYSLEHNDNNYRNVVYTNFKQSPITAGLDEDSKIIFYASGSIQAPGHEIILGDDTTYSSISEGGRPNAAAVLTTNDQVLALGDLTFFTEPYSAAENNGTLINNIADFLSSGQRDFELKDFPYFFNTQIDIVFDNTLVFNSQFEDSVKLKEALEKIERNVTFTDEIGDDNDVIFVGRFDEVEVVEDYLAAANITILGPDKEAEEEEGQTSPEEETEQNKIAFISDEPPEEEDRFIDGRIQVEDIGDLERGGSTLFYLHQEKDRNVLIILSDNPDTNADAFGLLADNELSDCLVSPMIAVCQTEEPDERLPPSLRSFRIDKILIVSDDDSRKRPDSQTSVLEYYNVLSDTYKVDRWITSKDGSPDVDQLLEYDAIIWTTGDYWDDSVGEEDVALLTKYVELGGNLIMSGASIAFDWDHTDFLTLVAHADYLDFAEQFDLQLALPDHPLAKDFSQGDVINFIESPSGEILEIDVVSHTPDARVIFERGPNSKESGAASVIAYEDQRVKIAYFAFPVYLLPPEEQSLLINNTIGWFTKKPLPLPGEGDYETYEPSDEEPPSEEPPPEEEEGGGEEGGEEGEGGENDKNGGNQSE